MVLSSAYCGSQFGEAEWRAAFAKDPTGEVGLLLPVRVQECQPPGLLASRVYIDLVGLDEEAAAKLLAGAPAAEATPSGSADSSEPAPDHQIRSAGRTDTPRVKVATPIPARTRNGTR